MTNHLELFHKFMTDTITNSEQQTLNQLIESDTNIHQEFAILEAIKTAIKRNLLTQKMNYLKYIEQTLKKSRNPSHSGQSKIIAFIMGCLGNCA